MTPLRLEDAAPSDEFSPALAALWWDAKGDWHRAHDGIAADESREAAWVHAYLHRKEGDLGNARYWYARAGKPVFTGSFADEWQAITAALLPGS